ncbi:EF-hand domain-containing protein [Planctellipticum variicoloris]|uniref:EF-hand domain-containing protein n=1 Tax=Planctellipticum variicoloris TaxID=3064265 RepID=UPI0030132A98|nr:EF-hand domain-containing protein [Planctomycetaceae bacterium SH412]
MIVSRLSLILLLFAAATPATADDPPPLHQDVLLLADEGPIGLRLIVTVEGRDLRSGWDACLGALLEKGDANADGTTTWEELAPRLPSSSEIQFLINGGGGRAIADREDSSFLKQKRGPVSRDELNASMNSLGFGPLAFRYTSEATPAGGALQTNAQQFAGVVLFSRLDQDRNGRLSRTELQDGLTTLRHLDENEDDLLVPAELDSTNRQGVVSRMGGSMGRSTDTGPFLVLPLGERTDAAVRMLLRRYDHAPARDGTLTAAELGLSESQFAGFDKDHGGSLDRGELAALLQTPPLRYNVTCDLPAGGRPAVLKVTPQMTTDAAPVAEPGRIALQLNRLQISFQGVNQPPLDAEAIAAAWLQTLDRDANEYLEATELRNYGLQPLFALLDGDRDEKVTKAELAHYAETRLHLFEQQLVITAADSSRNLFESLDANRDGRLSAAEFRRGGEQLPAWDANRDGELADQEVPQRMTLSFARDSSPLLAQRLGFARPASMVEVQPSTVNVVAPAWFAAMDRNSDGEISRQEFIGPLPRFAALDANCDGRIDGTEAAPR